MTLAREFELFPILQISIADSNGKLQSRNKKMQLNPCVFLHITPTIIL